MRRVTSMRAGRCTSVLAWALVAGTPAFAADLGGAAAPAAYTTQGVACEGPETKAFSSVWLGHFTGGDALYTGPGGRILLDWRDEKLCFSSRRACDFWVRDMRCDFHHPQGYFTCLAIR